MSSLKDYLKAKRLLDNAEKQMHKDQGAYEQALKELKAFGCKDLKTAKQRLREIKTTMKKEKRNFAKAMKAFTKKWQDKL